MVSCIVENQCSLMFQRLIGLFQAMESLTRTGKDTELLEKTRHKRLPHPEMPFVVIGLSPSENPNTDATRTWTTRSET